MDTKAHPIIIKAYHDLIDAGADIVPTLNSAVLPFFLKFSEREDQIAELHQLAVELAHQAIASYPGRRKVKLAGVIPSCFKNYQGWTTPC